MKLVRKYKIIFVFCVILICTLFWPFFLKNLYPFPGNYLLAWYQPWKTDHLQDKTITIQHKPVADDTFRYIYPFKKLGIDIAKRGQFPLWNPYNGAGMPLLATYQWAFLNPFNVLFLFLQMETAWTIYIIIQAFLLTFFTYLYCRKIGISLKGSIFATSIFTLSGFVVARLIFSNLIYPLTMLPLILYLIEDYIKNAKSKNILILPLAISFTFFSGHPHTAIYTLIVATAYFLYRNILTKNFNRKLTHNFLLVGMLFLIGVGLAGIQLIPTIELLKNSNMNADSSAFIFDRFLLPISHLISILIPNYFGNQATYNYWGAGDYIETVVAVGLIPSFFAYLSIFNRNSLKDHKLFFLSMFVLSILATINWFLPKFISTLPIPIISTSPPSRIFVITTFSIAILAGYGFDNWILYKENLRKLLFRILPFLLLIFIIFTATFSFYLLKLSCNNAFIQNCRLIGLRNTILEIFIFGIFIVLFLLYLKIRKRYIPFIIIFLILLIGGYNSYKFLPFSKKETLLPIHPLINAIKENSDNNRVFGLGEGNIKTNFATFFRFYDPNYFDPLHNRRYNELITFSNSGTLSKSLSRSDIEIATDINLTSEKQERRSRLLNILGVKNIIFSKQEAPKVDSENIVWQDKNWYLLRNNNAMPRTYFVSTYYLMNDDKLILKKLFDASFDPKTSVILEKPLLTPSNNDAANGKVEIINYQENEVTLNTKNNNNAILILTDNFYPGWKGYVDGKETKIYRANYTFRAIEVPSGKHLIRFSYAPESFKIGVILSLISITLYIMIIIRIKLSKKNND